MSTIVVGTGDLRATGSLLPSEAVEDMRSIAFLCSSSLLLICSCSLGTWIVGEAPPDATVTSAGTPLYDYSVYFRAFDNPWVGRTCDELIEALGPPDAIYEARHWLTDFEAGIPAATYIYIDDAAGAGHCIDAYVVDMPTATVIKHYCR